MATESLRALILESSAAGAEAIAAELRHLSDALEVRAVESEADLRASLASGGWHFVVANASFSPLTARVAAPLIVIGDAIGEEAAAECIRQGAADFVLSSNLSRLCSAVREALQRQREREDQSREQRLEVAEQLAAGIGHEFNNLLTVINGYSSILVRQPHLPAAVKSKLLEIDDAGGRATHLTGQLLAFARKHVRQPGVLPLNGVIEGMEPLLKGLLGTAIEFRLRVQPDLGVVHADQREIEQLIINLVVNARDAMPGGGVVEVQARMAPDGQVEIAVVDQGCGMTPQVRARIFEPFFSTKGVGQGIGLGLSIAHGIVKAIGGRIVVESEVNHGSTFRVILPPFQPGAGHEPVLVLKATLEARRALPHDTPARRENILVVEDQEALRNLIVSVLEPMGYNVIAAATAAEAIELCGAHGSSIDVLLTDVQMPEISGIELSRMIQESYPSVRTVYMSGGAGISLAAQTAGHAEFLPKPFTQRTLVNKIREVLDSSTSPLVLVVDDDPQIRNLLRAVLGEAGYRVEDAAGGRQALERIRQKTPDLLITDLIMPDVEGIETITRMRKIAPTLKIIAMSGSMDSVYLDTAKVLGASATFSKPLQLEALLAAVSGLLQPHAVPVS